MRHILLLTVIVCFNSICLEQGVRGDSLAATTLPLRENDPVSFGQPPYLHRIKSLLVDGAKSARNHIDDFIKPKKDFVGLFIRLHKWYSNYRKDYDESVRAGGDVKLPAPLDLMAARFVAIDRELQIKNNMTHDDGLDNPSRSGMEQSQDVNSIDSTGYLYDVLERMIDGLERENLEDLIRSGNELEQASESVMTEEAKEESEDVQIAMDRIKSAGANMAVDALQNEVFIFMRVLLSQVVAKHLAGTAAGFLVGGPLGSMMFAAANTPILSQYLANLQFRTVVGLMKTLNPGKWLGNLGSKSSLSEATT